MVRKAKILLLECTFFDAEDQQRARAGGHIHVDDLPAMLPRLENERIVLTHLSRRIMPGEAKTILRRVIGDQELARVSLLNDHRRRGAKDHKPRTEKPDAQTPP
ncbi:MAG: hypothetical protein HZB38_16495 [Planctomycetes bacterium]|nr:hypothetical protein [Planctomycetota bacterium]